MTPEDAKKVLAALELLDVIDGTPDRELLDMCIEIMKLECDKPIGDAMMDY